MKINDEVYQVRNNILKKYVISDVSEKGFKYVYEDKEYYSSTCAAKTLFNTKEEAWNSYLKNMNLILKKYERKMNDAKALYEQEYRLLKKAEEAMLK